MKLIGYCRRLFVVLVFCVCVPGSLDAFAQGGTTSARSITVVTEPNSSVWIDGVRYGVTDSAGKLTISSVSPGVRSIRVRSAGFAEITKSIPGSARGEVAIRLTKTTDEAELAFQAGDAMSTLDRQKAIAEYERATKLRPKYPEAYLALARTYADSGSIEKAFAAMATAKRLKPGFAEASAVEGRLLKDTGEEDKAVAAFKRAIAEGRGFQPEAYTGLGMLYKDKAESFGGSGDFEQEQANYEQAAKYLATAVKQLGSAPDGIVVYQLLGLIYERQKKYKEAIALYEDFLRRFPDASEAGAVASFITQIKKQMAEQQP
jgi:tetratricopeptide (TPR) repeat protein